MGHFGYPQEVTRLNDSRILWVFREKYEDTKTVVEFIMMPYTCVIEFAKGAEVALRMYRKAFEEGKPYDGVVCGRFDGTPVLLQDQLLKINRAVKTLLFTALCDDVEYFAELHQFKAVVRNPEEALRLPKALDEMLRS